MRNKIKKRLLDRVFPAGLALMIAGCIILMRGRLGGATVRIAGALAVTVAGSAGAFFFVKRRKRPTYLFFSVFFSLAGLYLLLTASGALTLKEGWPLLSVFAGLALLPAGLLRFGGVRRVFLIPALALAVLGAFLLLFSLDVTGMSFRQFMLACWPAILAMLGLALALLSISS